MAGAKKTTTKKTTAKSVERKPVTKKTTSHNNKMHVFAGFLLGLTTGVLMMGLLLLFGYAI